LRPKLKEIGPIFVLTYCQGGSERLGRWEAFIFQVSNSCLRALIKTKVCFSMEPADACFAANIGPLFVKLYGSHLKLFGYIADYIVFL
jgi:hypothetical protein